MNKINISDDRKRYLNKKKRNRWLVLGTQIFAVVAFIVLWEVLANAKILDSFLTSQPSRIWNTLTNLSRE